MEMEVVNELLRKFYLPGSRLQATEELLSGLVAQRLVPGLTVVLIQEGREILKAGYGYADLEKGLKPRPESTLFRAASVSKPIAATALACLLAEGRMELDSSLYRYLPSYPGKSHDFSIRQLAGHTAGIRGYRGKEYALNKPFSIREGIALFKDDPLLFEPGRGYFYNSFDWVLLSLAMEAAAGQPFEDYVSQKVLQPLGMRHTRPEVPGAEGEDTASFYSRFGTGFRKAPAVDNRYKLAGGGYLSTAVDIARLGQAWLDEEQPGAAWQAEFLKSGVVDGKPTWYGLGWEVSRDRAGRDFFGHTGNSVGAYSCLRVYPARELIFALLINCGNPEVEIVQEAVLSAFLH